MTQAKPAARASARRGNRNKPAQKVFIVVALAPIVLYFLVFSVYPVLSALYISFHDWSLMEREHTFIGLENYAWAFSDPSFYTVVRNTLLFAVLNVLGQTVMGLLLAVFVGSLPKRLVTWMRVVLFTPVVTSMVAVSLMFVWLYQPSFGIINYLLGFVGLGPFDFLQSETQVIPAIVLMTVWKNVGYTMVIFIAGLTTIPRDLYEAAEIDGANRLAQFWRITLPLLKPTIMFVTITSVISSLQVFTQIYTMTKGGPGLSSRTIVVHIYETAFKFFEMGRATSLAFILFVIIMVFTMLQLRLMRSDIQY